MEKADIESLPKNENQPIAERKVDRKQDFDNIIKMYLESNPMLKRNNMTNEFEIRFGTNPSINQPITKIEFDNVVQQLYNCGFKTDNIDGNQLLRIQNQYTDNSGKTRISNIRAEITGTTMIQEYCKTNNIKKLIDMPSTPFNMIKFTQKKDAIASNGERIKKVDMEDFNFRASFQTETDYHAHTNLARNIIAKWTDSLKLFRSMNRVRFYHEEYPVFVDLSIVKGSPVKVNYKNNRKMSVPILKYTVQEANVFNNEEKYEIELEIDNTKVGPNTKYEKMKDLANVLRKCIRTVLCGIQGSNYPISYKEKNEVLQKYMHLFSDPTIQYHRINSNSFIGPSSYTLQMENIVEIDEDSNMPNIRNHYTVTDKADGDRKLLYVSEEGKIYLIDTNMNVSFTGAKTNEKTVYNSLLDGEHIKYDKFGKFLNKYAAFDVYYVHGASVRELEFVNTFDVAETEGNEKPKQYRLNLLKQFIDELKVHSILDKTNSSEVKKDENSKPMPMQIKCKEFLIHSDTFNIFDGCSKILSNINDGLFEYNTDGLIFTPSKMAVGANGVGELPGQLHKMTWEHSFKWKPPQYNTIDFLVSMKKDKTGKDEVHTIFQEGKNMQGYQNVLQYKTLILRCGFSEKKHGYLNPFNDLINDNLPDAKDMDNEKNYKPVPFQPTNPFDEDAQYCNVYLKENGTNSVLTTEEGDYFEGDTIVEFKYIPENEPRWRWVPIRVRYDKTADLRSGNRNYGNAYHVANSNWQSIHNPITEDMIATGANIPEFVGNEDVYYNRSKMETSTQGLRDFHNLFVKSKLIVGVSNRGDTLIDYAVGKAGDLPKWIRSKLKFVYGIDISKDNILNQLDGACSRYLNANKKYDKLPSALFVNGNSGKNIRNGDAYYTDKDRQISKAIFGSGAKDPSILGKGVYKNYGIAESGFKISSCQFAMHYFFEDSNTLHSFLRNITECTKVNGYFIGTCYDGRTIFDMLKSKKQGEGISIFKDDYKIYELTKQYDKTGFPDDELSLNYAINVYQESINKVFREYLVNFEYLTQLMEDYGLVLITNDEAKQMDLPSPTGLFSELYNFMENEIKMNPKKEADYKEALYMSPEEKQISFMNRYFVFKKVRNVDAKKMAEVITNQNEKEEIAMENEIQELEKEIKKVEKKKLVIKKTGKVIKIKKPEN
tara:strand:- start:4818 stop:8315 length:3498 start_codon:yes stop_codon:yes gene_type:complete